MCNARLASSLEQLAVECCLDGQWQSGSLKKSFFQHENLMGTTTMILM
jgi:hypothetical protein